ncbi:MAG: hypothetical protein H0W40_05985 [Methylibium sp.]|uniref:hypothetical protein n=1 Tax=Methylibium sp. TaxID=2067992 RepID=UPI0017E25B0D|nr:hypothetical protein [Methylibium sp.]MBA3596912.1 hypothetical protein [Methylibium sp.]
MNLRDPLGHRPRTRQGFGHLQSDLQVAFSFALCGFPPMPATAGKARFQLVVVAIAIDVNAIEGTSALQQFLPKTHRTARLHRGRSPHERRRYGMKAAECFFFRTDREARGAIPSCH